MSDHPALLFHVGFPKCASTTLQRGLFDAHPQINSIGKPRHLEDATTAAFIKTLRFSEHFSFQGNTQAQAFFASQLNAEKLNVFSCEDIAVGPYWLTSKSKTADRHSLLLSLRLLGPQAKVLVILRDQIRILPSIYTQLRAGGQSKLPDFQAWVQAQLEARGTGSVLDALDYATYLAAVAEMFGRENVIVMDFADVAENTEAAMLRLATDLGLDAPQALGTAKHNVRRTGLEMRLINLWKKAPMVRAAVDRLPTGIKQGLVGTAARLGKGVPTRYGEGQESSLRAHFGPLNDQLRARWGLGENWSS